MIAAIVLGIFLTFAFAYIIEKEGKNILTIIFLFLIAPVLLIYMAIKEPKRAWLYLLLEMIVLLDFYLLIFRP